MVDIYVLNRDLEQIGLIDNYTSLIWATRYLDEGDCELYVEATTQTLELLRKNYFLARHDDDMVCRIETVELITDVENGNYLIVKGYDVKKLLSQRIVWNQTAIDGNVEMYIRQIVNQSLSNPTLVDRAIKDSTGRKNFILNNAKGFKEVTTQQVTYDQVSSKTKELCKVYGWGYRVYVENTNFMFDLYKGTDRTDNVIFSPEFENLIATKYIEDSSNLANVAFVGGEGEGSKRSKSISGYGVGIDRNEIFVDAKDISKNMTWEDLILMYPTKEQGGQGYIYETTAGLPTYRMGSVDIQIVDSNQLIELKKAYPTGKEIIKNGVSYYQIYEVSIAELETLTPKNYDSVILRDVIYNVYLLNRGYEKLAEYGTEISFEGSVEPNTTFKYKEDYFLGDLVTVENEYGISVDARIVEIIEIYDENGTSVEPKFEYLEVNKDVDIESFILTETEDVLTTENDKFLVTEDSIMTMVGNNSDAIVSRSKKISELPESTDVFEGCCFPIVTYGETKKIYFKMLKEKIGSTATVKMKVW